MNGDERLELSLTQLYAIGGISTDAADALEKAKQHRHRDRQVPQPTVQITSDSANRPEARPTKAVNARAWRCAICGYERNRGGSRRCVSCRCEFIDGQAVKEPAPARPIFSSFYEEQADVQRIRRERSREREVARSMAAEQSKAHARKQKRDAARFARAMNKLNSLVGLAPVKDQLRRATDLVKIQTLRAGRGMPTSPISHHMAFVGPPGTGKTTVARLVGELYAALGVVSDGHLVETDRTGLVGEYIGHTGPKTNALIASASGGVLFIDEAYSLALPDSAQDFGPQAIQKLMLRMENERHNFIVIVAGYPAEMARFFDSNPGLKSRFTHIINFPSYSGSELLQILRDMASAVSYDLPLATAHKAQRTLTHAAATSARTFGNARAVRTLLDRAIEHHASRVLRTGELDDTSLRRLEPEDVPDSIE
jgi:SpoVK/Ycf46/Vps4 family AAA+-type ATPase